MPIQYIRVKLSAFRWQVDRLRVCPTDRPLEFWPVRRPGPQVVPPRREENLNPERTYMCSGKKRRLGYWIQTSSWVMPTKEVVN